MKLICTLCRLEIKDKVYVEVAVPSAGGTRFEPRHLACDVRLRRIFYNELTPSSGDQAFIHKRIIHA